MRRSPPIALTALIILILAACLPLHARGAATLEASNSWIGNTYGYGDGSWTQIDIRAIAVTPDGKVYTNAPWDESGAEASVYQDGRMLGFAGGTHGWGNAGGNAIAVNDHYAYVAIGVGNEKGRLVNPGVWPEKGRQWYGISRRAIGDLKRPAPFRAAAAGDARGKLAASFLKVNDVPVDTRAEIAGLAASNQRLYATDPQHDSVDVYDAGSMDKLASFTAHEPGRIALAADGTLWLLTDSVHGPAKLAHLRADGRAIDDAPALPADTDAVDVAVDAKGRLLIADNGPRQQILIYAKSDHGYAPSGTLGERGGIFSGVAGRPGPQRFNGLTGVGADRDGNIYVAMNGIGVKQGSLGAGLGATLASYAPDGKLRWQVDGLLFVDGAWIDPARPNSVYTGNKRFELDFSKPAGREWRYAGFLTNRFKYPQDPVFTTDQWPGMPTARRLDGHTFLYLTDMYADHLKIYRFDPKRDGETAIPSGLIAGRARPVDRVPNRPSGGDWIWRDQNGNGRFEDGEFSLNTTGKPKAAGGWGWWIDARGDIWRASDTRGIHRFRYGGLDKAGNPIYSFDKLTDYPTPAPFTELRRAIYEPDTDTLYVTGYTADMPPKGGINKEVGPVLVRYDKWSSGEPVQRYQLALPWRLDAKPIFDLIGLTVEGRYLFGVEPAGIVHVYDKQNGHELGVIKPGAEVGHASGWVDVPFGISAHRRENGEYLIFVEEDARGKVMMYRWTPRSTEATQP
ncbi:hypothetical protein EXE55_16985 [Burkholderia glumae]|uniref:hypothetical protein n=1 Tax=Burkholderia glumae TaxID=337 RepID=UPI0013740BB1|nr:hypothetical protein EXE55_16985 [Burkholderia glumae]